MSDPMTNMEIEDVLSSIRRLVSEDLRPLPRDSSPHAVRAPEPEGKLVLTPAFRVNDTLADQEEANAESPVWRRAASRYRTESAETEDSTPVDAAQGDVAQDPEPWAESQMQDPPDSSVVASSEGHDDVNLQDEAAVPPETAWIEQQVAQEADRHDRSQIGAEPADDATDTDPASLEMAIAELEAAVAASDEEWEPDGSEMTSGDHFILPPMGAGRVMAEAAEAFGLGRTPSEPGLRRLHLEPGTPDDDPAEPVWADSVPKSDARVGSGLARDASSPESMFADDETVLDEGMLRELVIEVIRQELQGALGERITRNVRKLVRAEIHRALAGREFD